MLGALVHEYLATLSGTQRERIGQIECCGTVCCFFVFVLFIDLESRRGAIGELGK